MTHKTNRATPVTRASKGGTRSHTRRHTTTNKPSATDKPTVTAASALPHTVALTISAVETGESLSGVDVALLPGRAAFLPATQTLVCSDLHLGKAATFRRAGLPVPEGSAQQDLSRLASLVIDHAAKQLVIVGDLFHARAGCTPRVLEEFLAFRETIRKECQTEVVLVLGNHEQSLGRQFSPTALGIDASLTELSQPPFRFIHEPDVHEPVLSLLTTRAPAATPTAQQPSTAASLTIAGHLHPTISLKSQSGDRLTERCFVATETCLILPAFGSFTGGHRLKPTADMQIWLARDDGVMALSAVSNKSGL
jgi:metallophosphoesterase superfamily enzyme